MRHLIYLTLFSVYLNYKYSNYYFSTLSFSNYLNIFWGEKDPFYAWVSEIFTEYSWKETPFFSIVKLPKRLGLKPELK